ncbi:Vascular endothelial growth factor A [Camelus dromedarius]|uniref:Vascular endothelial growth factor A n=1 Tax=Camelus dromedarius TaxID=9838 RepID=A0A5N4CT24_CAMDR|nr:Vascular endothelial growth factor A [Camelus dromedarius]
MNFLLSWVHWSLALLLYLHHAKWSQAAPMTAGEQKPHEVVKFMDVYQRSYCRPIETLVDIFQEYPDEIEYIFKPSCVPLMRCGGCCNDEGLECVPTEEFNITMQIMRIKPHQGQHIGEMSFLQHNKCECRPKKDRARQEKCSQGHSLGLVDVTSRGGEPGWRKEPPSGFREPDVSPGKTDT